MTCVSDQTPKAVRVRQVRAETRAWLHELSSYEAREAVAELLEHGIPAALASMDVRRLLAWCPQAGTYHLRTWLRKARVSEYVMLKELTEDERWRLADVLRGVAR